MDPLKVARKNLSRATADATTAGLPSVGKRWKSYSDQIQSLAQTAHDPLGVINAVMRWQGSFESRHAGPVLERYASDLDQTLRRDFPQFASHLASFSEVDIAPADKSTVIGGRLVSTPVLAQTLKMLRAMAHCKPKCVFDIGGGIGATGRLWLTNTAHRVRRYIDMDLPESLFVAEVYLRYFLPEHDIVYIHDVRDILRAKAQFWKPQILLVPPHNHRLVRHLSPDLAYNTGSLQEMTPEFVDLYCNVIDECGARHFYSANFFAQKIEVLIESMNYAAPVMGQNWRTIYRRWLPDPDRGIAEMVFERAPAPAASIDGMEPRDGQGFLDLFDAVRASTDPDVIMSAVRAAKAFMPFVPKELLFLTRRAHALAPGDGAILADLEDLDALAAIGCMNIGMVGESLPAE